MVPGPGVEDRVPGFHSSLTDIYSMLHVAGIAEIAEKRQYWPEPPNTYMRTLRNNGRRREKSHPFYSTSLL